MIHRREKTIGAIAIGVGSVLLIGLLVIVALFGTQAFSGVSTRSVQSKRPFPAIDTSSLNDTQIGMIHLLKTEYETQPSGTKYTEGRDEPWCADFVSWIMRETGLPFNDDETRNWRIDDVPPLVEYYKSEQRLQPADRGYIPKVGDVVMYKKPSPFGNHTNIVVKNNNGILTTVGGNEANEIRIQVFDPSVDSHIIGYGTL